MAGFMERRLWARSPANVQTGSLCEAAQDLQVHLFWSHFGVGENEAVHFLLPPCEWGLSNATSRHGAV